MPVLRFSFEKCGREKQFLFPFISCLCQPKWSWHSSTSCKRGQEERFSIEKPRFASMYVCYLEISLHFWDADTAKFPNKKFAFAAHLFWCVSVMCSRILLYQIFASLFLSVCVFRWIAQKSDEFFSCSLECITVSERALLCIRYCSKVSKV